MQALQTITAAAALALCAAGPVFARAASSPETDGAATGPAVEAARAGIPEADRAFMIEAAQAGHGLVFASTRALSRASQQAVRDYAARMIEQRALVNEEIEKLARAKGVVVPLEPSRRQRSMLLLLDKADGAAFDREYIERFGIETHQLGIWQFEQELKRGRDADVKALARRYLPTLRQHMREAQDLRATLGTGQ